jgi:glucose-6-phosphate isomerase
MLANVKATMEELNAMYPKTWDTLTLSKLFSEDNERFNKYHIYEKEIGVLLDYSKNHFTQPELEKLLSLCEASNLSNEITRMFNGEKINFTEERAVLHVALRHPDGFVLSCLFPINT